MKKIEKIQNKKISNAFVYVLDKIQIKAGKNQFKKRENCRRLKSEAISVAFIVFSEPEYDVLVSPPNQWINGSWVIFIGGGSSGRSSSCGCLIDAGW